MERVRNIRNMDNTKYVCVYDIDNVLYQEVVDGKFEIKKDIGFYIKKNEDIIGVMASLRGPIFFVNNILYVLNDCNYEMKFSKVTDIIGNFKLIVDSIVVEDITYEFPKFTDYDAWSRQEDVDFFQWLYQSQESKEEKERFHEFYKRD